MVLFPADVDLGIQLLSLEASSKQWRYSDFLFLSQS